MGASATPAAVSKSTGIVICGKSGGKKREQAESLGVRILESEDFLVLAEDFSRAPKPESRVPDETGQGAYSPSKGDDTTHKHASPKPLAGLSVVITGSLPDVTRSEANRLAKELGAKSTPSAISKSTGLVVRGEKAGANKVAQVETLGIRMIDGAEFLKMVETFRSGGVE